MLVVETQTTTEDLLEGGTLAAEAGESAFAVSEEEHVAETAGTVWSTALLNALSI